MSLYFQETGTTGAPSIVFLHGVGTSGWMWWTQTAGLSDFHCLNLDLPGHGKSNHIPWVSLEETANQVAALIEAHATNGHAHIVGLSLGAYIGLVLLEHHANLVNRAVFSGVTSEPMSGKNQLNMFFGMMSLLHHRPLANIQAKLLGLPPDMQKAFTDNFMAMSMDTYRTIMTEAVDFSVPSALEHVTTPTLVLAGGTESEGILHAVEVISERMPNAQGAIAPGVKHGWNVQLPDLFNATVRAWLTDTPLPQQLQMVHGTGIPNEQKQPVM
jgi:pimeloyl-ACP methyl ester carboxylesterase